MLSRLLGFFNWRRRDRRKLDPAKSSPSSPTTTTTTLPKMNGSLTKDECLSKEVLEALLGRANLAAASRSATETSHSHSTAQQLMLEPLELPPCDQPATANEVKLNEEDYMALGSVL